MKSRLSSQEEKLIQIILDLKKEITALSDFIAKNPELGYQEFKASNKLKKILAKNNFKIEENLAGIETAFRASYNFRPEINKAKTGLKIAFLCEYDALPEIGHGCGHNMIAAMSTGAGIALSKLKIEIGEIQVIGCPAEETGGAKVQLSQAGIFSDLDAVMLLHPADQNQVFATTLAIKAIQFNFHGKTAHAAAAPEKGINALSAVIQLFNGLNALREHLRDDARLHGIISNGGEAANIVPDEAEAKFYFRARDKKYLMEIVEKAQNIAQGAALMTGCTLDYQEYENSNDNLKPNRLLADIFKEKMIAIGIKDIKGPENHSGSSDMGNVSHIAPAIHPYIKLGDFTGHTRELRDATLSSQGHQVLIKGVQSLALTALALFNNPESAAAVRHEFEKQNSKA